MKNKIIAKGLVIGFFTVGVLLMILGIYAGENATIMKKGVQICLECIGIG